MHNSYELMIINWFFNDSLILFNVPAIDMAVLVQLVMIMQHLLISMTSILQVWALFNSKTELIIVKG